MVAAVKQAVAQVDTDGARRIANPTDTRVVIQMVEEVAPHNKGEVWAAPKEYAEEAFRKGLAKMVGDGVPKPRERSGDAAKAGRAPLHAPPAANITVKMLADIAAALSAEARVVDLADHVAMLTEEGSAQVKRIEHLEKIIEKLTKK